MSGSGQTMALCPVCLADKGFKPAKRRNVWEQVVLRLVGRRPFRCRACDSRQILSANRAQVVPTELEAAAAGEGALKAAGPMPAPEPDLLRQRSDADDFQKLISEIRRAEQAKTREPFERRR